MEETIERANANTHERSFRPQINSFSDFGKLDRTLYPTERKRLLTFSERHTTERVRNFTKTKRGIKNRGDFLRLSSSSSLSNVETDGQGRRVSTLSTMSYTSEDCFEENLAKGKRFRIVLYGIPGVGKSCFLKQMRTSEFLGTCPDGPDPSCITVPVVLDGQESILDFVEAHMYIQNHGWNHPYDAFVMMFSVTDKRSFHYIANRVERIRKEVGDTKPIYIVANKTDLIRFREVSSQVGMEFAKNNNCYYAEVSVPLQLNVDKLLVDITDQLQRCYKTNSTKTTPKPSMNNQSGKQQEGRLLKKSRFSILSRLRKFFFKNTSKLFPES